MTTVTLDEVNGAIDAIAARFGPTHSNGVTGILIHDQLAETFDADDWGDWFVRPAPAAFDFAHDLGLISAQDAETWSFTDLGKAVAKRVQAEMRQ